MALPSLFEVRGGINLGSHLISGDGAPGGAGGRPDDAVKGSLYLDETNGSMYLKKTSGTGTNKWVRMQGQDDLDTALLGQSWREPALVRDNTAYTAKSVAASAWVAATSYALDDLVIPDSSPNAHYYKCTTAGDSDVATEPTWPIDGSTVADDTVVWTDQGLVAELALNLSPYQLDGVVVADTNRVLLENIVGEAKNVFVVTGTPGSGATLVEDGNAATQGDALYIQDGTDAGKQFVYNSTDWIQQGGASSTEISYLQTFIGKSANGNETTDFGSNNVVTDGDSLEKGISDLDAEVGAAVATPQARTAGPISDQAINLNIENLDDAIGADVTSTNQATSGDSANENISALDAAIGADVATPQARTVGPISVQAANLNVESLDDAIGPDVTSSNIVSAAGSVNANISALDAVVADTKTESKTDSVTTLTTLDTVLVDNVLAVEWLVHARSTATGTNIWAGKVLAIHNGTSGTDATAVDYNTFAGLKTGSAIPNLDFEVDVDGVAAAQTMRLRASSNQAVNIRITRSILNEQ